MAKINSSLTVIFFVFTFLILVFFHIHGFISYDDGWFLQAGLRFINGEKIYKDFQYLYNPGSIYINALAFFLFGKSILSTRIIAIINSLISIIALYWIGKKINTNNYVIFSVILIYVFWGPGHVNFVWPVIFCVTTALVNGALFLKANSLKQKKYLFFLLGVISALTFILKQNFGLAIFLTDIFFIIYIKEYKNIKLIFLYFSGYLTIIFLQAFYFLYTKTLIIYIKEIYFYTVVKIFEQGLLNSSLPWEFPSSLPVKIIKIVFYFLPFLISIFAFIKILQNKKNKILLYFPLITGCYYFLSIRPTTDYIHLTPLLSLSSVNLLIVFHELKNFTNKLLAALFILILCIFGAYSSLFRNYYRWNTPLVHQNIWSLNPRVLIITDEKENRNITEINGFFQKNYKNEKYIFIYNFAPIYYFILDKKNPTPYDFLHGGIMSIDTNKEIIKELKRKKINHIITNTDISHDSETVANFILENYKPVKFVNEYTIWQLKPS